MIRFRDSRCSVRCPQRSVFWNSETESAEDSGQYSIISFCCSNGD